MHPRRQTPVRDRRVDGCGQTSPVRVLLDLAVFARSRTTPEGFGPIDLCSARETRSKLD